MMNRLGAWIDAFFFERLPTWSVIGQALFWVALMLTPIWLVVCIVGVDIALNYLF